jgi:hypothetical protein
MPVSVMKVLSKFLINSHLFERLFQGAIKDLEPLALFFSSRRVNPG